MPGCGGLPHPERRQCRECWCTEGTPWVRGRGGRWMYARGMVAACAAMGHRRALTVGLVGCILLRSADAMSLPDTLSVTCNAEER